MKRYFKLHNIQDGQKLCYGQISIEGNWGHFQKMKSDVIGAKSLKVTVNRITGKG